MAVGGGGTVAAGIAAGIGPGGAEGRGSAGLTIMATGTRTTAPITTATIRRVRTLPPGLRIIRLSYLSHLSHLLSDLIAKAGA